MALQSFYLGMLITYLPRMFFGAILVLGAIKYFSPEFLVRLKYRHLIISAAGVRVLYAAFQTVAQYFIWSGNGFTQLFLSIPIEPSGGEGGLFELAPFFSGTGGYFLFYSFSRFWLNVVLSLVLAWLFWRFLKFLEKRNERFFETGEASLGFLSALLVGWPGFVVFIPLVFISVVLVSIWRKVRRGETYTTLGMPFMLAAALWLAFSPYFTRVFGLTALYI